MKANTFTPYPKARTVKGIFRAALLWGKLPPGTRRVKHDDAYLFFDKEGRYLARNGMWRTPKESA